ncbi:hypothetical protein DJICPGNB_09095 [Escherichia coli]|nr:hypothetical protein DJICPGNB_09095 [Escherichia coli]
MWRKLDVLAVSASGGDGTINEVSTALIQCEGDDIPALGILPLGTANDFATSVGIPEALDKALKLAISGNAIAIDMAQVNKQTCFINMATGGFGTRITTETPEKLKAITQIWRLTSFMAWHVRVIFFCNRTVEITLQLCRVTPGGRWCCNGRQAGGGQQLCPNALLTLNCRLHFYGGEILQLSRINAKSDEDNPNIIEGASSWFDIQAPHEITFNLDGELHSGDKLHINDTSQRRCVVDFDCPIIAVNQTILLNGRIMCQFCGCKHLINTRFQYYTVINFTRVFCNASLSTSDTASSVIIMSIFSIGST